MKTGTWSRPSGNISANHCGHQHLLIPEEPMAQGSEGGDFLVKTLAVLLPCLAFHVKLFLFPFLDKLFSWCKVLWHKKTALQQLFNKSFFLSLPSNIDNSLARQPKLKWRLVNGTPLKVMFNCSGYQFSSYSRVKFCDIILAEGLFNNNNTLQK